MLQSASLCTLDKHSAMYIRTANFLSKISLQKKKKKKKKSTTITCEDQRALKNMLQNVH
jgi:hypothetical protein